MQKIKIVDDIEFAYHDSGAPAGKDDYYTVIVIHGHTFHSGTFLRMLEVGKSLGYRVILPNRRLYEGSTPYTKEETEGFDPVNPPEVVSKAYLKQGRYLLLLVNQFIKELGLKKVILTGWSLGSGYLATMAASMANVDEEAKSRLRQTIKTLVWWDPPATVHGVLDPPTGGWIPLYDPDLGPEERGQAFAAWVTQYYPHADIDKKDCHTLIYKNETQVKPATYSTLSLDQLLTKIDPTAGIKGDNYIGGAEFQPSGKIVWDLAFLTPATRKEWEGVPFNVIYGEQNPWPILWSVWKLEEQAAIAGLPINIKGMPGVNHFGMEDAPETIFKALNDALPSH